MAPARFPLRQGLWQRRRFGGLACLEKVDVLQAALVTFMRHAPPRFMRNIAGWRETDEEMAGNGGVFIKRHQLMET